MGTWFTFGVQRSAFGVRRETSSARFPEKASKPAICDAER
jgi:hypothetical protein